MKKIILSLITVGSFITYSIASRIIGNNDVSTIYTKSKDTIIPINTKPIITTESITPTNEVSTPLPTTAGKYKDGLYTGNSSDAFYGNIQVKAVVTGGKITDVLFLQAPSDRQTSIFINQQAEPILKQEAIQAQSADVDIVSGATDTSEAFKQSLQSALNQANI